MNTATCRGLSGELRWGAARAATLGPWTLTADTQGLMLTATVTSADTFRMSQPSVTFCVVRPKGAPWIWDVASLQIAHGTVTARLRAQEESHGSESIRTTADRQATAL